MGRSDTFNFYLYNSDDGNSYCVKLSEQVAAAGGFTQSGAPDTNSPWPYGTKNLRHVWGIDPNTLKRVRLPIHDFANSLYVNGGNFSLWGLQYDVEGRIGEKRRLNTLK